MTGTTTTTATQPLKLPGTPKPWMNASVSRMLRLPVLDSLLGRKLLLLTVTGAKTGTEYTTPVQYVRRGDELIVLSQRRRTWWRNIATEPIVHIRLQGAEITTSARVAEGEDALDAISAALTLDPRTARFYGVEIGDDGSPDDQRVQQLDETFVAILIHLPVGV